MPNNKLSTNFDVYLKPKSKWYIHLILTEGRFDTFSFVKQILIKLSIAIRFDFSFLEYFQYVCSCISSNFKKNSCLRFCF